MLGGVARGVAAEASSSSGDGFVWSHAFAALLSAAFSVPITSAFSGSAILGSSQAPRSPLFVAIFSASAPSKSSGRFHPPGGRSSTSMGGESSFLIVACAGLGVSTLSIVRVKFFE